MLVLKVISRLLDYPSKELLDHSHELCEVVNESRLSADHKTQLVAFITTLAGTDLYDAQERYDLLFERGRSLSLLLFEHVHGESRDRGQAMVNLMSEYEGHGFDAQSGQLPDYIPLYLEFLSEQDAAYAREWLADVSHILTVLSERLLDRQCDYRILFESLVELSGATVEREKIAEAVRKEPPDDTMEAIDKAWEDKEIRFDDPIESGCESSRSGGFAANTPLEAPVVWQQGGR
ncbi:MAG: nitrate reductase molybdenum cofactor assembly chaperone [Gammaproteobacteria bacterium]|nr:MAG: nitrate reductase molybdenum cofactor assembly chaperone [Gammaproteobacteria bacterium]